MKKVLSVCAIFVLIALVFTACGEKETGTVFKGKDSANRNVFFTFNKDNTWTLKVNHTDNSSGIALTFNYIWYSGTYSGNPKANGAVSITAKKQANTSNSSFTSTTITNTEWPLESITETTTSVTITNGRFNYGSIQLTRQQD